MTTQNSINIATGTAGQVLTSNGEGVAPTFQAPSGGGGIPWVLRETITFSGTSAEQTTSSFTNASTARMYKIVLDVRNDFSGTNNIQLRFNGNSAASSYISYSNTAISLPMSSSLGNSLRVIQFSAVNQRVVGEIIIQAQEGPTNELGIRGVLASEDFNGNVFMIHSGTGDIGVSLNYLDTLGILGSQNLTGTFNIYQI